MRVATAFTGAAACAAAFTPAAMAGTGHQAQPGRNGIRPNSYREYGKIRKTEYCSQEHQWLHLNFSGTSGTFCWGFAGRWYFSPTAWKTDEECGGTNRGSLFIAGQSPVSFGPGKGYRHFAKSLEVQSLSIRSWTGTDSCPNTAPSPG
jgi:hypothetical protein